MDDTPQDALASSLAYYVKNATHYQGLTAGLMEDDLRTFVRDLPVGARVLDAGCGPGRDLERLVEWGFLPAGLDFTAEFCEMAKAYAPVVRGDLRHLPFSDSSFDGVWACAALVHLERSDVVRNLHEVHRILKVGGLLSSDIKTIGESDRVGKDEDSRWFNVWTGDEYSEAYYQAGFDVLTACVLIQTHKIALTN